jgi:multiple sugar transport system permease protein
MGLPFPVDGWLLSPSTALPAIMAMDVWISAGYYMVLFLAGMEAIPKDLYESAELVGASPRQQFFQITLPLLRPTLLFVIVINSIKSFQVFVEVYVMTKGGPLGATSTLVYEVYHQAFEQSDSMGYASAVAFLIFVTLMTVSLFQLRFLKGRT